MVGFNISNINIIGFYSYPSTIQYRLSEYNELKEPATGDEKVKRLFELVLKEASNKLNKNLMDNKVAFKIEHIPTNTILYVGYKDNIYALGLNVYKEYGTMIEIK